MYDIITNKDIICISIKTGTYVFRFSQKHDFVLNTMWYQTDMFLKGVKKVGCSIELDNGE